jgi:hypothetical protein
MEVLMLLSILRNLTNVLACLLFANSVYADDIGANISGDGNDLTIVQAGVGLSTTWVNMIGDSNTANISQKDSGNHNIFLDLIGNNHSATILQQGSGDHSAIVILDGDQPWNFDLTQSGATSQSYSSSTNGTCNAIGGCNLTVNQQ